MSSTTTQISRLQHTNIVYKNAHIWCNDRLPQFLMAGTELKKANEGEWDLNYILELLPVSLCKLVYMLISYESGKFISK